MALIADAHFVKESSSKVGTIDVGDTLTLLGAEAGFQTFNSGVGVNNDCIVTLRHGAAWQVWESDRAAGRRGSCRDSLLEC